MTALSRSPEAASHGISPYSCGPPSRLTLSPVSGIPRYEIPDRRIQHVPDTGNLIDDVALLPKDAFRKHELGLDKALLLLLYTIEQRLLFLAC